MRPLCVAPLMIHGASNGSFATIWPLKCLLVRVYKMSRATEDWEEGGGERAHNKESARLKRVWSESSLAVCAWEAGV